MESSGKLEQQYSSAEGCGIQLGVECRLRRPGAGVLIQFELTSGMFAVAGMLFEEDPDDRRNSG
jgi:hypothetical protein